MGNLILIPKFNAEYFSSLKKAIFLDDKDVKLLFYMCE